MEIEAEPRQKESSQRQDNQDKTAAFKEIVEQNDTKNRTSKEKQ